MPAPAELRIDELDSPAARAALPILIDLLQDAVSGGASVGFLPPLALEDARRYWEDVIGGLTSNSRVLLAARLDGRIVGTVQLALETRRNGDHRAEVQKLLVHSAARRRGIGRALMEAVEQAARAHRRSLLVLDTRLDDPSDALYRALGYTEAGRIPGYARSTDGSLHTTVFFYKMLA
ncbi:MAG: GNAT family N-acetyltransferase [Anaerolineae bacterium]|nr:GNAT family N-acetyltransferase [Anaerolineae bacterium]